MYNYIVTAQKATAVHRCITANFTAPDDANLIINKRTRLEIHKCTSTGLAPFLDVPIYGRIEILLSFRPKNLEQDLLFLCTENHRFCVLGYDAQECKVVTKAMGEVKDRIGRLAECGPIGLVDPENRLLGLHLYDGMFKAIPMDPATGKLEEAFNMRIEELHVVDIVFLHGYERPTLLVLYEDSHQHKHVKTYELRQRDKEIVEGPWFQPNLENGARMLIPVPPPFGGAFVVGDITICYLNGRIRKAIEMKETIMKCYCRIDNDGSRYLLGDCMGVLYILLIKFEGSTVQDLKLERLGKTTIPKSISYLDNGVVFVGSGCGDSKLIKLNKDAHPQTLSFIQELESYTNLGPIIDFCVVDLEKQGQGQIVTCSGIASEGTLRVIRSGIGINEQAAIELPGVKGMWSIRENSSWDSLDKFLVVTFVEETKFLSIVGEEMEDVNIPGFCSNCQSLYVGCTVGNCYLQITPKNARLVSAETLEMVSEYIPPSGLEINVAAANMSQILLSTGSGNLVYLEVQDGKLIKVGETKMEHEISCLNINPFNFEDVKTDICAVGLWTDISVRILQIPSLVQIYKQVLDGEVIPRAVVLAGFEGVQYLLVAQGDGQMYSFQVEGHSGLKEAKKISLGRQPASLTPFRARDSLHIFASSDRPTVIHSSNRKLLYSNVNIKEVSYMSSLNTAAFPHSLAIATEESLIIGTIDDIQKLHIKTIPLGETPRRIVHQESSHSFLVITEFLNEDGVESVYLRLLDDQTFDILDTHHFDDFECAQSLVSCQFEGDLSSFFVVGTAMLIPNEPEPKKGKIYVIKNNNGRLSFVSTKDVKGAVYSLCPFNGRLIAAVNNEVIHLSWNITSNNDGNNIYELKQTAQYMDHIVALYMATRGDFIVVGDLMNSISLLNYSPMEESIVEIARDYNPNWMTAVEILDDDTYIGGENNFNIFTVRKNTEAVTEEERCKLETVGEFHTGEFINRFRHGSIVMRMPETEGAAISSIIFGSTDGTIGVIAQISKADFALFEKIQSNITHVLKGVGGLDHKEWRSFRRDKRIADPSGFIDGDLVETFLDLPKSKQQEVVKGLEMSIADVTKKIETLAQQLH